MNEVPELQAQISPVRVAAPFDARQAFAVVPTGSYGTGLVVGSFLGILGFVGVYLFSKGTETRRGVRHGLVVSVFMMGVVRAVVATLRQ